ncbi:Scr1 family TA system antitoxin-like transcriptional regulator [Lentzea flava]|uniref:HTH cro/C1-type domain-containing protein n=1 Tax=Lentzea flava TaxID=103732 RepID=A0ABQ2UKP6_9PSEU|nr:Scr1 family TA system antitoxin-like transcriptional regulator [Lentzea flava]MCP2199930.1 Helix-turn-helix domain-containing protein [Lentzea flava]GGU39874.1 hypothetical protein GCM10010178_35310 [Lentzea flava]
MPKRSSTARGREFGDGLRKAIAKAGFTSRALAEILGWDEAKLSDLINGKGGTSLVELGVLLGICRVSPAERDHLLSLFPVAHIRDWLQHHGPDGFDPQRTFVENLTTAETLVSWELHKLPILLRTQAYVRAELAASGRVPAGELEASVKARLEMQQELRRRSLKCVFYIHEVALRLPVGGHDAHVEQVHHVLRMAVRLNIVIRVVPTALGAHVGMSGSFTQLTSEKYEPLVCVNLENSTLFVEDKAAVQGYETVVRTLDQISLGEEESKALIVALGEELSGEGPAPQMAS